MSASTVGADAGLRDVSLRGVDGVERSLRALAGGKGIALVFVANGCPTARAYEDRLQALHDLGQAAGIPLVAVNANNPHLSPPDTFEEMVRRATERKFKFPYLQDRDGVLARRLGAVCTPHAFLLNDAFQIVYSGRIDDSRLCDRISSSDLRNAIADLAAGRPVAKVETEPFGCAIVW
jgi:AhpC/TSA family